MSALAGFTLAAVPAWATPALELRDWTASFDGPEGPWRHADDLPDTQAPNRAWIRVALPPEPCEQPTLYVLGRLPAFRVTLDGRELARQGDPARGVLGAGQRLAWHGVDLPREALGGSVVLEVPAEALATHLLERLRAWTRKAARSTTT